MNFVGGTNIQTMATVSPQEERQRDGPVRTDAKDGELQPQVGDRLGP